MVQRRRARTTGSFDLGPAGTGAALGRGAVFAGRGRCFSKGDTKPASAGVGGGTAGGSGYGESDGCSGLAVAGGRACEGETAWNWALRWGWLQCGGVGAADGRAVVVLSWAR